MNLKVVFNTNMGDSKWILRLFLQISLLPLITALECYTCSDMRIISRSEWNSNDVISHLVPGLMDSKCRKTDSQYNNNYDNNYNNQNQQQFNTQNGAFQNNQLHPNHCQAPHYATKEVMRCGVWEGRLNITVFQTTHLVLQTFSFGCISLMAEKAYGCHDRSTDVKDKKYFENILFGTFQNNARVNFFRGTLCLCDNASCQLAAGASRASINMILIILLIWLGKIVSSKLSSA